MRATPLLTFEQGHEWFMVLFLPKVSVSQGAMVSWTGRPTLRAVLVFSVFCLLPFVILFFLFLLEQFPVMFEQIQGSFNLFFTLTTKLKFPDFKPCFVQRSCTAI